MEANFRPARSSELLEVVHIRTNIRATLFLAFALAIRADLRPITGSIRVGGVVQVTPNDFE
jgi:hypothetical protein